MTFHVKAIYENGVLKLDEPLQLSEGQRVSVTVSAEPTQPRAKRPLIEWKGSVEDLEYLAESPDNSSWAHHDDDLWQPPQQ